MKRLLLLLPIFLIVVFACDIFEQKPRENPYEEDSPVDTMEPQDNAPYIAEALEVRVVFKDGIHLVTDSATNSSPELHVTLDGETVSGTSVYNEATETTRAEIVWTPSADLEPETEYRASVEPFRYTDSADAQHTRQTQLLWNFTTADADTVAPTAGTALVVGTIRTTEVDLSWGAATDNTTAAADLEYRVVHALSDNVLVNPQTASYAETAVDWTAEMISCTVEGLTSDTDHYLAVLVRDTAGNMELYSQKMAHTLNAAAPEPGTGPTFSGVTQTGAVVNWTAASDDATPVSSLQYKLVIASMADAIDTVSEVNAISGASLLIDWTANILTYTLTGLTVGTDYYLAVLVRDGSNNMSLYSPQLLTTGSYTLTYHGNTNDGGTVPATVAYLPGDDLTLATQGDLYKTGHDLTEWNTDSSGIGAGYTLGQLITAPASDLDLYAIWTPGTYDVVFMPNGGTGDMDNQSITFGQTVGLNVCEYTNNPYSFDGWSIVAGGPVVYGDLEDITMNSEGITLYAKWYESGTLDLKFGGTGIVTSNAIAEADYIKALVIQQDNKIVACGSASDVTGGNHLNVARYQPDGGVDVAPVMPISGNANFGTAVALQNDGRIVAAGYTQNTDWDFAAARLTTGFALDSATFGTGGIYTDSMYVTGNDEARAVKVQNNGKILIGGYAYASSQDIAVVRLNPDGSYDTDDGDGGFGLTGNGKFIYGIGTSECINDIAVQADGKILLAGFTGTAGPGSDFLLIRLNENGRLDTTFNSTGIVLTDVGEGDDEALSVQLYPDGRILVGGYLNDNYAIVRYNSDGSLDTTFDGDGILLGSTVIPPITKNIRDMVLLPDGKIVVAGDYTNVSDTDIFVIRYNSNGTFDTSFGTDMTGIVSIDVNGTNDACNSIAVQPDGKIVLGGITVTGGSSDFLLIRLHE
ncbi:MAG: InlB B-repeat-containing protein [Spirochaetales bacterium]|nr:InlB B-repeat-containing protein [Spirochaetales bacterium]